MKLLIQAIALCCSLGFGFTQTAQNYQQIPIINRDGLIVIATKINNQPAEMYLDTGSTSSVIDKKQLAKYSLSNKENATQNNGVVVGSNQAAYTPLTIQNLSLGPISLQEISAVSMGLDDINFGNPHPIAGILGQDVLLANKALISFADLLLLWPDDKGQPYNIKAKKSIQLKRLKNGFFIIPVTINTTRINLLLDSGSPDIILDIVGKKAISDIELGYTTKTSSSINGGNQGAVEKLKIKSIKVGPIKLKRTTLIATDLSHMINWLQKEEGIKIHGTMGLQALVDLKAVLDLSTTTLYVE